MTAASRADTLAAARTRSVEVIGRADLDRTAARTVADLLATRVGVDVQRRSPVQNDLSLRGGTFDQVLVLVDGVRMSDRQTGHHSLNLTVPLELVERVEIIRGGGATLYGSDAVGGVVHIVTRRGSGGLWRARGGAFGTAGAAFAEAATIGEATLRVAGEAERSDGHRPGTDYRMALGDAGLTAPVGRGRVQLQLGLASRDFGAAAFYAPFDSYEATRALTTSARLEQPLAGSWSTRVTAAARRHSDVFTLFRTNPRPYQNVHEQWQSSLEAVIRGPIGGGWTLASGAEGFVATIDSKRRTNGTIIPALGDRTEQRAAVFGELATTTSTGATITGGVRLDWSSVFGAVASPSAAAMVPLTDRVQLRASADRGFRAPTWTDRFYVDPANVADSTIGPETFWAGELGVRAFPRWGRVDIAAFARRAVGLIDYARPAGVTPPPVWRTYNFARAMTVGVEGQVDLPTFLGAEWTLRGSALDFTVRGAEGFEGKYALRPVVQSYGATARFVPWRGALLAADGRRAARAGEARFSEVNLRLAQDVGRTRVVVDAMNLLGAQYLDASGVPVMGRGVFVGLELRR